MARILPTPVAWPRILLPVEAVDAPDPLDLDAAVARGAFRGLKKTVHELGPTAVTALIATSRLRGRGGAGYPAADKWRACSAAPGDPKYVVANGFGADPAVTTDRTLLERNPYAVLEGLVIAAMAVGAHEAFVAVRTEATGTIRVLEAAIAAAEDAGFLGPDLLASGYDLAVIVRPVQGAYMLGEETVLLHALEGKRGQPDQRPPYPATSGLFGQPTLVHNVQTLAAVPWIVVHGVDAFRATGLSDAPGTALVQVSGSVANPGIAEIPLGTSLGEIVALAGGVGADRQLKAVLVGGPAGGLLPPEELAVAFEFGALRAAGAHVGSGSLVVADERACVVDLAKLLTRFCADEACGKSIPCRIGTRRLAEIGQRITDGMPKPTDLTLLTDLAADVEASALCDHERLTTLPLLSALRYFRAEVDAHVDSSICPAGVCHPIAVAGAGAAH